MSERVRKNYCSLNLTEKQEYIDAILALKADGGYDELVNVHHQAMMNATPWDGDVGESRRNSAHRGPSFLPWHRQYLLVYERELQRVSGNPNLALPYWNWLDDARLPDPKSAAIWSSNNIGGDGNPGFTELDEDNPYPFTVMDGPFERWPTGTQVLERHLGLMVSNLPTMSDHDSMMSIDVFDTEPWDDSRDLGTFRNALEGWFPMPEGSRMHNQVHVWVGGSMLPGTSPNDPVFYMHHCFVDRLWADWQRKQQADGVTDLADSYQPHTGGPIGHNIDDPMFPWHEGEEVATARSMLDYRALGFRYDNELPETAEDRVVPTPKFVSSKCHVE